MCCLFCALLENFCMPCAVALLYCLHTNVLTFPWVVLTWPLSEKKGAVTKVLHSLRCGLGTYHHNLMEYYMHDFVCGKEGGMTSSMLSCKRASRDGSKRQHPQTS